MIFKGPLNPNDSIICPWFQIFICRYHHWQLLLFGISYYLDMACVPILENVTQFRKLFFRLRSWKALLVKTIKGLYPFKSTTTENASHRQITQLSSPHDKTHSALTEKLLQHTLPRGVVLVFSLQSWSWYSIPFQIKENIWSIKRAVQRAHTWLINSSSQGVQGNLENSSESHADFVNIGNDRFKTFSCLRCCPPIYDKPNREESPY